LCDVLICVKYEISLVLSSACHFLTDDLLQFADRPARKPCCCRETADTMLL